MKCPICKEEIHDEAIKCKHCGEIQNKTAYAESIARSPQAASSKIQIPIGWMMQMFWKKIVVPLVFLGLLLIAFNAPRFKNEFRGDCLEPNVYGDLCRSFVLGPVKFHFHNYADYTGWSETGYFNKGQKPMILFHSPVFGISLTSSAVSREYGTPIVVLPIVGVIIFVGFLVFWWRFASRRHRTAEIAGKLTIPCVPFFVCIMLEILLIEGEFSKPGIVLGGLTALGVFLYGAVYIMRQLKAIKNMPAGGEVSDNMVLTLQFGFQYLGLAEKIILSSAVAALFSLFLPWISMGIISSSGWNQQGYIFFLLFVYPVIGVFNVKGLNKIAGIICGALALAVTIWYIADKHYEIMGVTGNASGSGLYLFAASTIGLIVGAVKYKRPANR